MACSDYEKNITSCNCTYPGCPRKGSCCACLRHHLSRNELPACAFSNTVERTWDRSFTKFIESNK
ncbi:MAG TPA: hypothetical protein DCL60_08735 [Armatimonadetes bacterium]|jgi:hypothetical protein|nr:hypothetical protein [Armatimonadota bacterium]